MHLLRASARWDPWRVIQMSPAPVCSSWLRTNWLRWEPPRWEMRTQQLNTIDMDVETNCITRPQRSELTCSAHDCRAAVLIRQRRWAAAKSKTIHDPRRSVVTGHMTSAPLFSRNESVRPAVLWNRKQESSQPRRRAEGRLSNFRIIRFAAAIFLTGCNMRNGARLFRLKVQPLDLMTASRFCFFLLLLPWFRSSRLSTGLGVLHQRA